MIYVFGFKKKQAPLIESGKKVSMIRRDRANGRIPRPGDTIRLYVGLYTRSCRLIREINNFKSAKLFLQEDGSLWFQNIDQSFFMDDRQKENFAREEGFCSFTDLTDFFQERYQLPFYGIWIRWQS